MSWYNNVVQDISNIPAFVNYYEQELSQARKEISVHGNLESNIKQLPAYTEIRFNQLQEIEAVLNYLNIQMRKLRKEKYIEYERYQKALSSREIEKYVDGEDDIISFDQIINDVAFLRNKFLGIMKALESKNFMMGYITKLRCSGMEDIEL